MFQNTDTGSKQCEEQRILNDMIQQRMRGEGTNLGSAMQADQERRDVQWYEAQKKSIAELKEKNKMLKRKNRKLKKSCCIRENVSGD